MCRISSDYAYMVYKDPEHYNVILKSVPQNRSQKNKIIGVLRALSVNLHSIDAKYVVDHIPYTLGKYVREDIAETAKNILEEHGCEVELQSRED